MERATNYVMTQLLTSREWFRLVNGVVNVLQDCEVEKLFGVAVGPIGQLAKGLDGAYYGKKALEDWDAVCISTRNYVKGESNASITAIFNVSVKCIGDSLATLNWVGAVGGIIILAHRAKTFKHVKSVCSVYSAVISIYTNGKAFSTGYHADTSTMNDNQRQERRKQMIIATAGVITGICSMWLNGMGGLDSWVGGGPAFAKKGLKRLQPWTFHTVGVLGSVVQISRQIAAPAA